MNVQEAVSAARGVANLCGSAVAAPADDERLLVAKAKAGHPGVFGELYTRNRMRIYRTALRMLGNHQDAEDAVQRTFQHAFTHLAGFRGDSAFSSWITRIAINEALMLLRQRRASRIITNSNIDDNDPHPVPDLPDGGPTPEQALARAELRRTVIRAIATLRPKLRIVLLLSEYQGLSNAETARCLGLSVAAVKARNFHARRHLRQCLRQNRHAVRPGSLLRARNRKS